MSHTTVLIIIGIALVAAAALALWTIILKGKEDLLAKREVALDERDERLSNWENLLAGEQKTFDNRVKAIAPLFNGSALEVSASYTVTESDEMKYNTDKAIFANAKNRLAMTIAHNIVKKFEPKESTNESGRRKFTYNLYITE